MDELAYRTAVTLLGAGPVSAQIIEEILAYAPKLVAADGGAKAALAAGLAPDAVIGDFDSLTDETRRALPHSRFVEVADQDTTDFEKCLMRISAPLILGIGFTGARIDHELAVYNALVRLRRSPCVILGSDDLVFAAPMTVRLDVAPGTRVSLFPLAPASGRSTGLRWPIDGLELSPDGRVGTSNEATGAVEMRFDSAGMLVIMPREALEAVIEALHPGTPSVPAV